MSGNLENDRSVTAGKMYHPIDLAQKITIVKSMSNTEVKMTHLIPGQPKTSGTGQIITHTGPVGMMRPAAILSPSVSSQPQMIVSGSPLLQGAQIVSQGSQMIGPNSQIISQSQIISPSGQILSPGTQIISQGTQLSAQGSNQNTGSNSVSVPSSVSGQVLSVGGLVSSTQGLVSGAGNLVVSSSVRTLPPSVRVLPPMQHHSNRPVHVNVNVSTSGGVLVSKGVTSHVPRGLAAGASLAVRPVAPVGAASALTQGWAGSGRGRGALVYGSRGALPRAAPPPAPGLAASAPPAQTQPTHSAIVTLPATTVLTSSGVISSGLRSVQPPPRAAAPAPPPAAPAAPRPLPLLQRNYQPAKVVGVASVGVRGVVGNSAPAQLYYEVPRAAPPPLAAPRPRPPLAPLAPLAPVAPMAHALPAQVSVVSAVQPVQESRPALLPAGSAAPALPPRPTILRKRDTDGSPTKSLGVGGYSRGSTGWEDVPAGGAGAGGGGSGGSTTMSASSSPAPDDEPEPPPDERDLSPRKKPRKQMLSNSVRQCAEPPEEPPASPVHPPPKRPQLSSTYVCGWRSTALHFTRPGDVRRREPRAKDILALASQRHVLTSAEGWKVHHLTAQMDDLMSLEADVGSQLASVLKTVEGAGGRALTALQPHSHNLLELIKGNIQRSKIVCEGIQEARDDILRVFKHRNFVSDILSRQADKRCFRKHRSQS